MIGHARQLRDRWPQLPLTGVSESNLRHDAAFDEVPDHVLAMRQHLRGPKENGQHYARRLREAFPEAQLEDIALIRQP